MHLLAPETLSAARTVAAYVIFGTSYMVFAIGRFPGLKIDRTGAAILGAVLMFACGVLPVDKTVLRFIDFPTLVLLFSMMIIVLSLYKAGFFDWIADIAVVHLKPRHLLPAVIFTSGILSAFLVNDIICLAMVPLVLLVTRKMRLPPLPYLLAVATASNIGSVATITGNPQNILIGSYSGIHYLTFMRALGPVAVVGLLIDWAVIRFLYKKINVVIKLIDDPMAQTRIKIKTPVKLTLIMLMVLCGFLYGLPPAWVAAVGAAMMLASRTCSPREMVKNIDWKLLVFFTGLFLIIGGVETAGIDAYLQHMAATLNLQQPVIFTAFMAACSNIISNVPAVMLIKPVVAGFADAHAGWLLLAMATTLAGNLTIVGSVANIIVVEQARGEVEIGFLDYVKIGIPVTLLTLAFGLLWLHIAQ